MKPGKMAMMLLGKPSDEKDEADEHEAGEGDEMDTASETLDTAAQELIDAVASKDVKAVGEALRSAFAACK